MKIASWNVNGYRAVWKKNFLQWMDEAKPDVACLQETKSWPEQLTHAQLAPHAYHSAFSQPERKGYSGVGTFSKTPPSAVQAGFGDGCPFDSEGRVLITEHLDGELLLANIYFPNGKRSKERLQYKLDFYDYTLEYFSKLKQQGRKIIVCGDYNTAHKPIDLARPMENEKTSGFLPIEREWLDRWTAAGFVDTFRMFTDEGGHYTWWDMRTRARDRGIGWRIDYHFASENLRDAITGAWISDDVFGSDHCPLWVELDEAKV